MKISWGYGIAILYLAFVGMIMAMVFKSCQHDVGLVSKNYYEQDLRFEEIKKKIDSGKMVDDLIKIRENPDDGSFVIHFPQDKQSIDGTILLFRPSDSRLDEKLDIALNDKNEMSLPTIGKAEGHWRVQINWTDGDEIYYNEKSIFI